MLDFLKGLILHLPGFTVNLFSKLTHGSLNERLEYIIAAVLFLALTAFLFVPGALLKLRKKILFALLFSLSPIMLLFIVPVHTLPQDARMAATWPFFALIATVFAVIYIFEEILLWRPLSRRRHLYYPTWLKPPERYKK